MKHDAQARYSSATRLTQTNKRRAKGAELPPARRAPQPQKVCQGCGKSVAAKSTHGTACAVEVLRNQDGRDRGGRTNGRISSRRPESKARLAATQRRQAPAGWNRNPASPPAWLIEEVDSERIQPRLRGASLSAIAQVGVSTPYASAIRGGRRRPRPRHWPALAELIGMGQAG